MAQALKTIPLSILSTLFLLANSGCKNKPVSGTLGSGSNVASAMVTSASFSNNQLELFGSGLDQVTSIQLTQASATIPFTVALQTATHLLASLNANATVQKSVPINMVLNSPQAQAVVTLTMDLSGTTVTNFKSTGITDLAASTAMTLDASGNVGIGTTSPNNSLVLRQRSTTDGFLLTGDSVDEVSSGTGLLFTLGMNVANNKQILFSDPDYPGLPTAFANRFGVVSGYPYLDVVSTDGTTYGTLNLGVNGGGHVAVDGPAGIAISAGSNLWVNGNAAIGSGYQSNAATTNGLIVQGNVGIGTTSPVAKLDVSSGQTNDGIRVLSGNATNYTSFAIGGTTDAAYLGFAGGSNQWVSGSAAGDVALTMNGSGGKLYLASRSFTNAPEMTITGGNVGIGTTAPAATLSVNGYAQLKSYSSAPIACSATYAGSIALTHLYVGCVCNSSSWVQLSDGVTVCTW